MDALLDSFPLGERVPVTYVGAEGERRIEVLVEDLLPGLPPPGSAGLPPSAPALRSRGHSARLLAELWK